MANMLVNQGTEITVNTTFDAGQATPAAKVLANGNILVTWNDEPTSSIQAQIIQPDGTKVGEEFFINQQNDGGQSQSSLMNTNVAVLSNGDIVVTWVDNSHNLNSLDNSGSAVKARVLHLGADGAVDFESAQTTDEFLVNTRVNGNQSTPTVTALDNGTFVVVWSDANLPAGAGDAAGSAIRGQIFNNSGTTSGSEFLVNTTTAGNQTAPFIAKLADGTFVVTWIDAAGGGDILGQRYDAAGAVLGIQFTIDADADADTVPVIAAVKDAGLATGNGNNNFVVAWVASGGTNVGTDIHYKLFTYDNTGGGTDGGPANDRFSQGAEQIVNSSTTGNQNSVTLLGTSDGGWVVGFRNQDIGVNGNTANAMFVQYDKTAAKVAYVDGSGATNGSGNFLTSTADQFASVEQHLEGGFGSKTVFPALVQLQNGDIMMFYEERLGQGDDANDESIRATTFKSYVLNNTGATANQSLSGTVTLFNGNGNVRDIVFGAAGADILVGGATSTSSTSNTQIDTGDDILVGGGGGDYLNGVGGSDTASYFNASSAIVADLQFGDNTVLATGYATTGDAVGDSYGSIENLTGSAFNDRLFGDAGANIITGGAGDDYLTGRGGADALRGGDGHDTADYGTAGGGVIVNLVSGGTGGEAAGDTYNSIENVIGTNFADTITGNADGNIIKGGGGDDILDGGTDQNTDQLYDGDYLDGGDGTDTVTYANAASGVIADLANGGGAALDGSAGDAQADVYVSIENLTGSANDDTLSGNSGANVLTGNAGNDVLEGRGGADKLVGGLGIDTASYASALAGVTANLLKSSLNRGDAKGDTFSSIENLTGSAFNDKLTGGNKSNVLNGGAGADVLDGGKGTDTASYAGAAAGVAVSLLTGRGTAGDAAGDKLIGIENLTGSDHNDTLTGGKGNNVIEGGGGADSLVGGAGADTASYAGSEDGVTVDLGLTTAQVSAGDASGDVLTGFENLTGSAHDDTLIGNASANTLTGGAGDDVLEGKGGADKLVGGDGDDTASYEHSLAGVTANLDNAALNKGDAKGDTYSAIENLRGSAFGDKLTGDDENNVIEGGAGNDTLAGGDNADEGDTVSYAHSAAAVQVNLGTATAQTSTGDASGDVLSGFENLEGSAQADTLTGDANDNVLIGGAGADTMDGGAGGNDSFVFDSLTDTGNVINNFTAGPNADHVVFDYAAMGFPTATNVLPAIEFGAAALTNVATLFYDGTTGALKYDADGTGGGAAVTLAMIYSDVGTSAAALTLENLRIIGLSSVAVDD